jgi:hypothetical protein
MLAFRVSINDCSPVTGGAADLSVLTATVTATGALGPETFARQSDEGSPAIELRLGGLTDRQAGKENEHVLWMDVAVQRGDRVLIEVMESAAADPVTSSSPADSHDEHERQLFEFARKNYFALREKYEPRG